jgi:NAD(P)-dependent dehydrogenase (short-subunit alcohol dehydrogenase family)
MMKNLSTRLAEFNISVNDVAPAMIGDTGMKVSLIFPGKKTSDIRHPLIPPPCAAIEDINTMRLRLRRL